MLRPGTSLLDISETMGKINRNYGVYEVEGVLSHQMKRFVIDGTKAIPNKISLVQSPAESDELVEEDDVFAIDIVVSTPPLKKQPSPDAAFDPHYELPAPREQGDKYKPTIFKRNVDATYMLKLASSRQVHSEIMRKAQTFPFCIRQLETRVPRVGIKEMIEHNMLSVYPSLFEREGLSASSISNCITLYPSLFLLGCIVAQIKMTCLVTEKGTVFISGGNQTPQTTLPFVGGTGANLPKLESPKSIVDPALLQLLSAPLPVPKPKKKKNKKKSGAAAADAEPADDKE